MPSTPTLDKIEAEARDAIGGWYFHGEMTVSLGVPHWWNLWAKHCKVCGRRIKGVRIIIDTFTDCRWGEEYRNRYAMCLDRAACHEYIRNRIDDAKTSRQCRRSQIDADFEAAGYVPMEGLRDDS